MTEIDGLRARNSEGPASNMALKDCPTVACGKLSGKIPILMACLSAVAGSTRFSGLAPGRYVVRLMMDDGYAELAKASFTVAR